MNTEITDEQYLDALIEKLTDDQKALYRFVVDGFCRMAHCFEPSFDMKLRSYKSCFTSKN